MVETRLCYDTSCAEEVERYGKEMYTSVNAQVVTFYYKKLW